MRMKLVVVSDNHGLQKPIDNLKMQYPNADAFFHCGDSELPAHFLDGFISVCGNNDSSMDFPDSRIVELDGIKILVTHGHRYIYFGRLDMLVSKALYEGCKMVFFGHTHSFHYEVIEGVHLVNPGSITYNRDGSKPSYALVTLENGQCSVKRMER